MMSATPSGDNLHDIKSPVKQSSFPNHLAGAQNGVDTNQWSLIYTCNNNLSTLKPLGKQLCPK
jgi:hypothetical protein